MENDTLKTRVSIVETRIASLETRQAFLEKHIDTKPTRKLKRELSPEEKQAVRTRLVAGQEKARAHREPDVQVAAEGSTKSGEKEVTNGAPTAEN